MYVNPFWLGVLITIVVLIAVAIIAAMINAAQVDEVNDRISPEEFKRLSEDVEGKLFKIVPRGDGTMEIIEYDRQDEDQ